MHDPPRGSYYPAGGISAMQQPRQYQYSATNPWQREEREKVMRILLKWLKIRFDSFILIFERYRYF